MVALNYSFSLSWLVGSHRLNSLSLLSVFSFVPVFLYLSLGGQLGGIELKLELSWLVGRQPSLSLLFVFVICICLCYLYKVSLVVALNCSFSLSWLVGCHRLNHCRPDRSSIVPPMIYRRNVRESRQEDIPTGRVTTDQRELRPYLEDISAVQRAPP